MSLDKDKDVPTEALVVRFVIMATILFWGGYFCGKLPVPDIVQWPIALAVYYCTWVTVRDNEFRHEARKTIERL